MKSIVGKSAVTRIYVDASNTAKTVGSGSLDVFATPMMIALMERAACDCLEDCLDLGQTSVGVQLSIEHLAASPIGLEVTAAATVERVEGRTVEFTVTAHDGIKEIGKGRHKRVIVDEKRFLEKAGKGG